MKRSAPLRRRTPLRRSGRRLKRTGLSPVSDRRKSRDDGYGQARQDVYDRADGLCEIRAADDCTGRCEQVHHVAGRGGDNPHRLGNLLACCHRCHRHVHEHPAEAYEQGWMVRRLGEGEAA